MQTLEKDVTKCYYCECTFGSPVTKKSLPLKRTRDHIIPVGRDGNGKSINLVWACHQCNHLKGSRLPEEFSQFLEWKITAAGIGIKSTNCFSKDRLKLVLSNNNRLILEIAPYRENLFNIDKTNDAPYPNRTLKQIANRIRMTNKEKDKLKKIEESKKVVVLPIIPSFLEQYNSEYQCNFHYTD